MKKLIEIRTGSNSDIPKIKECYYFLKELGISFSPRILSAHRTPELMAQEARDLEKNGFLVSIAAAGGSAHLAGMTASETCIPVVALPVTSSVGGLDALLSMAQMPPGIPNGCLGLGQAENAAILAARIMSLDDMEVRNKLSSKLDTKILAELNNIPNISIVTDNDKLDTSLLDRFGINYSINSKIDSPVVIYILDESVISKRIPNDVEQISIISPTVKDFENFKLSELDNLVDGPYAFTGVQRVSNSMIYAAQILGNYFPNVRDKFKEYKHELYLQVVEKDKLIQEKGVDYYL
ncbi:MAG: AIR carboxylase family protein [Nanoarchaeales archaeon]|nr:AIR carboxylase family protein [Nanoarchaeales archaeon]